VIDHNLLTDVTEISSLTFATHIDISHNQITQLPDLTALMDFAHFDASYNQLQDVTTLPSAPNLGTQSDHYIAIDHNYLTLDDCPAIQAVESRTDVSGATFLYEIQIDLSFLRAQYPSWPIVPAILLDWVSGLNQYAYVSTVECD